MKDSRQKIGWRYVLLFLLFFSIEIYSSGAVSSVVVVRSSDAMISMQPQMDVVQTMMETGLTNLTGETTVNAGLQKIFSTNDVIGIKVYGLELGSGGTRCEVVQALISCLKDAGIPLSQIIIWDRSMEKLHASGFVELGKKLGVKVSAVMNEGFDTNVFYSSFFPPSLVVGDVEFELSKQWEKTGKELSNTSDTNDIGRRSFVSNLLTTRFTKIILVTPLMHHNTLGITGNIYNLAGGCTDNFLRFELDGHRLAEAATEIYAMEAVGDKVVFSITDALGCQYRGQNSGFLHYSLPVNELRFSTDPVALDWESMKSMLQIREKVDGHKESLQTFSLAGKELCENAVLLELGNASDESIALQTIDLSSSSRASSKKTLSDNNKKESWWKFWKW